jgi:phosphonate transport system permease protein
MSAGDPGAILARHRDLLAVSPRRRALAIGVPAAMLLAMVFSIWWLGLSVGRLGDGFRTLAKFVAMMIPPATGGQLPLFLRGMAETLAIAFLGTVIATAMAIPLALLAAANTAPSRMLRFLIRRMLDTLRGIDTLIWALVFVGAVGLGPFAGILAIAVSDTGSFGKLFSEAIESTGERARESVLASGGAAWMGVRFGLLPQVLPVIASQVLYYFESNTRSATIIGIVGAGGIGLQLSEAIRTYEFDQVAFIVLLILVAVAMIDWISGRLRFAIIGRRHTLSWKARSLT